jgi:hypothetical protein
MARAITAPANATTQPSPYAEHNLMVEEVIEAVGRGFTGDELLEHLAEVAGTHYAAAMRETPQTPSASIDREAVLQVRPGAGPRDPFEGVIGAGRYFALHGRFREGRPAARRCLFADPDLFLAQAAELRSQ